MQRNKRFAQWLVRAREAAHLTQAQLAERMEVTQVTVSYWEDEGRLWMEPEVIIRLATNLRVEPVDVAEALGYPTRPMAKLIVPMSRDRWMEELAALEVRLHIEVESWGDALIPPEAAGERTPNGRTG